MYTKVYTCDAEFQTTALTTKNAVLFPFLKATTACAGHQGRPRLDHFGGGGGG